MKITLSKSQWEKIGRTAGWSDDIKRIMEDDAKYPNRVKSALIHILMEEEGVSEKAFSEFDRVSAKASEVVQSEEILSLIKECETNKKRPSLCAEMVFDKVLRKSS